MLMSVSVVCAYVYICVHIYMYVFKCLRQTYTYAWRHELIRTWLHTCDGDIFKLINTYIHIQMPTTNVHICLASRTHKDMTTYQYKRYLQTDKHAPSAVIIHVTWLIHIWLHHELMTRVIYTRIYTCMYISKCFRVICTFVWIPTDVYWRFREMHPFVRWYVHH